MPGLSPGSVDVDNNGDPLFYYLSITFDQQNSAPIVTFVADRTVGNFYAPGTSTVLSDQDIINEAMSAFTPSGTGAWTVNSTRPLFEYIGNPLSGLPAARRCAGTFE